MLRRTNIGIALGWSQVNAGASVTLVNPAFLFSISPGDFYPFTFFLNWPNPRPLPQPVTDFTALFEIHITGFFESDELLHIHKNINDY